MTGPPRAPRAAIVALGALLLLVGLVPTTAALEDSTRAIKAVGSSEYTDRNAQAYASQVENVYADGRGELIAVLDTGVDDQDHPTFSDAVAGAQYYDACDCVTDTNPDPLSDEERVNPDDENGHGTHVASIALGNGGPDVGPRGVAPNAGLVDVKISNSIGVSPNRIAKGIDWVLDYNAGETNWTVDTKIRTIVVSHGELEPHEDRSYEGNDAMQKVKEAFEKNVLVVAAAGNCGPGAGADTCPPSGGSEEDGIPSPAATPEALAVGAVDDNSSVNRNDDEVAGYSSRGPNPADNASDQKWRKPDVLAPGSNISAACHATTGEAEGMDCTLTGTSMAAPHVGGLAAIMWEALDNVEDEDPTAGKVKNLITRAAQDIGEDGWDPASGYGYVDAYETLVEAINEPPVSDFVVQPPDPEAGEEVVLDASPTTDPNQNDRIDLYKWKIDDREEKLAGDQPRLNLVFNETGSHTIELTAVDSHGTEDPEPRVRTIHVSEPEPEESEEENSPPTVELAYGPRPVEVGQETWFDVSNSTDPDGDELVGFRWDFDANDSFDPDRQTEGPTTTWTFEEPGMHDVEIEVKDANGAPSRATTSIEVEEEPKLPPAVSITNPQDGDVIEPGPVNVTWIASQGPVDNFGVSVDETAIDTTENRYLEVQLSENDTSIAVQANGPGGTDSDRVNISVVEEESLQQSSTDEASDEGSQDEAESNPPRPSASDDGDETLDPATADDGANESAAEEEQGVNQAPGPGLAIALGAALSAAAARRRR